MGLAYVIVIIVSAAFSGRVVARPFVDGDLFWQKHLGEYVLAHHALPTTLGNETFTAAGLSWTPQEWLLGVAAQLAFSHGIGWVLAVAAGATLAATMLLCAYRARQWGASGLAVAITMALLAVDLEGSFGIRAQVFAWLPLAALLAVLDLSGAWIFLALPIVALWANVHGSVVLAIPLIWIDAAVGIVSGPNGAEKRRRFVLALLAPLAMLATPLGIALPIFAWTLFQSPIRHAIYEWQPLGWRHDFFWGGGAPMVLLILVCLRTLWRERPRDVLWSGLLLALTIQASRNAALLGIVLAPLAARAIDVLLGRFSWWPLELLRSRGAQRLTIVVTGLAAALVFVVSLRQPPRADTWLPPVATFARLAELPGDRRVFCFDFSVCSLALDYPNLFVFIDGRTDAYPLWLWSDFDTIRFASRGWNARLARYRIDTVVAGKGDSLDRALRLRHDWSALPVLDRCCRAYVLVRSISRGSYSKPVAGSEAGRT
ncbi:MAG: hypothetical protein JO092_06325 [Candidatus Eremiobacteraeota bacterium]|nr:hypothetical protein [Candidatus Eremiobacteraeota bacterium]